MFLAFKNGAKSMQIAGYNGARTVFMYQNVAYRPTVYKTGIVLVHSFETLQK